MQLQSIVKYNIISDVELLLYKTRVRLYLSRFGWDTVPEFATDYFTYQEAEKAVSVASKIYPEVEMFIIKNNLLKTIY